MRWTRAACYRQAFLGLCVALLAAAPAVAQSELDNLFGEGQSANMRYDLAEPTAPDTRIPLEGAVDPEAYVIGPGDLFTVTVNTSPFPLVQPVPVSAEGYLTLPDVGAVPVAGRSLAEARADALAALAEVYRNVGASVTLTAPRAFYVHVSGAVTRPGRYPVTAVTRLSKALAYAYSDSLHRPVANRDFRPALRNVLILRGADTLRADVRRYHATGDPASNPYLRDGDVIRVPAYDPDRGSVFVDGAVPNPGTFDVRPDDTARDLLAVALAGSDPVGLGDLRLLRRNAAGRLDSTTVPVAAVLDGTITLPLQPLDHLSIRPARVLDGAATAEGWVMDPGTYPIEPGVTTVRDLIDLAGGLRPGALLRGAYLERRILPDPYPGTDLRRPYDYEPLAFQALRPDSALILQQSRLGSFDYMSRFYLAQEMRLQNRVSIDLPALLAGTGEPIPLEAGDKLVVPRDEATVLVVGQVARPGYVAADLGQPAAYYIGQAGGLGDGAGEIYVIDAATGEHLPADAEVSSGDVVFVDRALPAADTPELQRLVYDEERTSSTLRTQRLSIVLSTVSTLATTASIIVAILR